MSSASTPITSPAPVSSPPSPSPPEPPVSAPPSPSLPADTSPSPSDSSSPSPPPPDSSSSPSPSDSSYTSPPPTDSSSSTPSNQTAPSKSTPSNSSGNTNPSQSPPSSTSVSTPLVVGIGVGAVVLLLLSVFCFCWLKKKKRRMGDTWANHPPPPHPPLPLKDNPYGAQPLHWQQNIPPPAAEHHVQMPPPPFPPPKPPQYSPSHYSNTTPVINSSGGSRSNHSGGSEYPLHPQSPSVSYGFSKSTFMYEELRMATDGFSDANLLGSGGFGYVHRGVLPNGKEVAVKQLKAGSGQGEREFQAEVEIISRVHHKHLVSLVGYCISGLQRLLVYEFVPNNTMEFHLHGEDRPVLDWPIRLKIALGSAKGLAYLHEDCHPKIIHRDIKATNILIDFNFEAKVADFGLAKIASENNTHVSTRVMGTFGYLAPEYASSGKLTDRSDVFSYGVMLLELITGRRPVDSRHSYMDDSLVDWARPVLTRALDSGVYDSLVDERLGKNYNSNEMERMVTCAAACVRHSARRRPKMSQIVRALEGDVSLEDLNEGVRPGQSRVYGSYDSTTDYDSGQYNKDMQKFKKMALSSNTYSSSAYSAPTSEYGLNLSASSSEGQRTQEVELLDAKKESRGGFSRNIDL